MLKDQKNVMTDLITVFHNVKNFTDMWDLEVNFRCRFTFYLLLLTDGLEPFYFIDEEAEI